MKSPFGWNTNNDSLQLSLRLDGDQLAGQDAYFTYTLSPEEAGQKNLTAETLTAETTADATPVSTTASGAIAPRPSLSAPSATPPTATIGAGPTTKTAASAGGTAATTTNGPAIGATASGLPATRSSVPAPSGTPPAASAASPASPGATIPLSASQLSGLPLSTRSATNATTPAPDPRAALQTANKVVKAVRDVKAAATSSDSLFDRMLATASAALNNAPKPDGKAGSDDASDPKDDAKRVKR